MLIQSCMKPRNIIEKSIVFEKIDGYTKAKVGILSFYLNMDFKIGLSKKSTNK